MGASDESAPRFTASGRTIRVPADAKTIQAGVDKAKKGDLVLVSPGVYKESVTIGTDGIVLRGAAQPHDPRRRVQARQRRVRRRGDGVAVENLTARNFTENGFFWNGVLGYRASYLTAYRNGDYGIYAYASQYGQFDHSYASRQPRLRLLHRAVPRHDGEREGRGLPAVAGAEAAAEHAPGFRREGASGRRTGSHRPRRHPGARWQLSSRPAPVGRVRGVTVGSRGTAGRRSRARS